MNITHATQEHEAAHGPIPPQLSKIVVYLNRLLAIDPEAITTLLDHEVECSKEIEQDPQVLVLHTSEKPVLTGFGLIAGFCNSGPYLLIGQWRDATNQYRGFYVGIVVG